MRPSRAAVRDPEVRKRDNRVSLLRHLAISAATVAAYVSRAELHVSVRVLWVIGLTAVANLVLTLASDVPVGGRAVRGLSTVFGVAGWTALVYLTGGVSSPFVAGFWLEIVLSGIAFGTQGTLLTAAGCAAALSTQQLVLGVAGSLWRLGLQLGFVAIFGLISAYASRRAAQTQQRLSRESDVLGRRLRDLECELEAARTLGQLGEATARLAHGLKNAVHSLRGFAKLIDMQSSDDDDDRRLALDGLRLAIDRLEVTARDTLQPQRDALGGATTPSELECTFDEIIVEMARTHSGLRWVKLATDRLPRVALPSSVIREVLLILAQNAAEASRDGAEIVVRAEVEEGLLCLAVQDRGPGFSPELNDRLFRPGTTTKATGSGFGLFLARRLVEASGGSLTIGQAPQGGALVAVRIPVQPN